MHRRQPGYARRQTMEFCPPPWPTTTLGRVVMTPELASAASMGWYQLGDAFPTPLNASAKRCSSAASEHATTRRCRQSLCLFSESSACKDVSEFGAQNDAFAVLTPLIRFRQRGRGKCVQGVVLVPDQTSANCGKHAGETTRMILKSKKRFQKYGMYTRVETITHVKRAHQPQTLISHKKASTESAL